MISYYILVSCLYDKSNKTLKGYLLCPIDTNSGSNVTLPVDKTEKFCNLGNVILNATFDSFFGRLVSTGKNLSEYPHITEEYAILTKNALTVCGIIDENGIEKGVRCFNALGKAYNLSISDFEKNTVNFIETNYVMKKNTNGVNRPYPNDGSADFHHFNMQKQTATRLYNSSKGEKAPEVPVKPKEVGNGVGRIDASNLTPEQVIDTLSKLASEVDSAQQPTGKRRGRPPKNAQNTSSVDNMSNNTTDDSTQPKPKKRGRPPKNQQSQDVNTNGTDDSWKEKIDEKVNQIAEGLEKLIDEHENLTDEEVKDRLTEIIDNATNDLPTGKKLKKNSGPYLPSETGIDLPTIGIYSLDILDKNPELNQSAQQKMFSALMNLRKLAPYYSTIYEAIEKKLIPGFGTFGVTEKRMIYDLEFPASLSVGQISFVLIHEMMHICMLHSIRKLSRNHELWNIATDLYINSIICHDFGVTYGGPEKSFENGAVIQTPPIGIFLETIDEVLDFSKDTPESIYARLLKENPQMQQSGGGQGQKGQGQQGQGQSGQSSSSQSQQGQQGQSGSSQGQSGQSGQEQGQGSGGSSSGQQGNQQGQSSDSGNSGGKQDKSDGQGNGDGSDKDEKDEKKNGKGSNGENEEQNDEQNQNGENGDGDGDGENGNSAVKEVNVTYNGKKLTGKIMMDICTENRQGTKESMEKNIEDSKKTLQKINTKIKMVEEELGQELTKEYGIGGGLVQRSIEFGLAEGINWKVLLKNICTTHPKKMYTTNKPDKTRMNMGMTVATRHKIGKPTRASNFIVAIDVSGSVSKKELDYFLSEVNTLSKRFDVEGELIYWSTNVGDAGIFSDMIDLLKVQPNSTGGTDVKCVFDYITGKIKTETGKKEETKLRDIRGVFIITDGCFAQNYGEYTDYFDRRTVWLIDGNPVLFEPLFGKVLAFETPEDL